MPDVFISCVEEDLALALALSEGLEAAGFTTWCYERHSVPGPSYLLQTGQAIEECRAFLILLSRASLDSSQIDREVVRALETGKHFIPVLSGVAHAEFQVRRPEWRQAIGGATSILVPADGVRWDPPPDRSRPADAAHRACPDLGRRENGCSCTGSPTPDPASRNRGASRAGGPVERSEHLRAGLARGNRSWGFSAAHRAIPCVAELATERRAPRGRGAALLGRAISSPDGGGPGGGASTAPARRCSYAGRPRRQRTASRSRRSRPKPLASWPSRQSAPPPIRVERTDMDRRGAHRLLRARGDAAHR